MDNSIAKQSTCEKCKLTKPIDQFISKNGKRVVKHCLNCRTSTIRNNNKYNCVHNRFKYQCKLCLGSTICKHRNQRHECLICSPEYYLKRLTLTRIQSVFNLPTTANINVEHFLGCKLSHFKEHLELTFRTGMTWENHGNLWEIDHRVPLKYKNPSTDEIINRFHYSNTHALYACENRIKQNSYIS